MSAPTPGPTDHALDLDLPPGQLSAASVFDRLPTGLLTGLTAEGITEPTPVQTAVIPDALEGHDVLGRARTGSGKTLAFGLPILVRLSGARSRPCHPRALVVVPTRELAVQVAKSLTPLAAAAGLRLTTVYGGTPYERQTRQLRQRADLVVATPGRLQDLVDQGYVFFDDVQVTVLDEADHLCDLGFYPAVDRLVGLTPPGSQRLLLSATLDGDVDALVRAHLREPRTHELDPNAGAITTMTHHTVVVGGFRDKVEATVGLVEANGPTIVFTRTREAAMDLAGTLSERGVVAVDLHGDLSQRVRERHLQEFRSGRAHAVVATDVAARGIHVDGVDLVVHFDAAQDAKAYLHRSGRTARAGRDGCVVTLTTPKLLAQVQRTQSGAGVEVLHHDSRTAPRPMTAQSLAETGGPAPAPAADSGRRGRPAYGARTPHHRRGEDRRGGPRGRGSDARRSRDRSPQRAR